MDLLLRIAKLAFSSLPLKNLYMNRLNTVPASVGLDGAAKRCLCETSASPGPAVVLPMLPSFAPGELAVPDSSSCLLMACLSRYILLHFFRFVDAAGCFSLHCRPPLSGTALYRYSAQLGELTPKCFK